MARILKDKTFIEIISTIFIIAIIILVVYASYIMVTSRDMECYWTTKGIICGGKLGE